MECWTSGAPVSQPALKLERAFSVLLDNTVCSSQLEDSIWVFLETGVRGPGQWHVHGLWHLRASVRLPVGLPTWFAALFPDPQDPALLSVFWVLVCFWEGFCDPSPLIMQPGREPGLDPSPVRSPGFPASY